MLIHHLRWFVEMVLLNETIQWSCSGLRSLESLQRSALRVSAWTKLATAQKIGGWLVKITGPSGALTKFIKIAYLFGVKIYIYIYWKDSRQSVVSAVAVRAFCLLGSDLLSLQAGSRPVAPECHVGMTKCTVALLLCTQGCVVLNIIYYIYTMGIQ